MSSTRRTSEILRSARDGRLRWAVNAAEWYPKDKEHGEEFKFLLALVKDESERSEIMRKEDWDDKKRALLSRLLSLRASAAVLGLASFADIEIGRTRGKKPFLKAPRPPPERDDIANFNFNVSHEGGWVVLASEPLCVCGVDVAAPAHWLAASGVTTLNIYQDFSECLTTDERRMVRRCASFDQTSTPEGLRGFQAFQHCWSAKESFVKARGDGMAFDVGRAGFEFSPLIGTGGSQENTIFTATVKVDGELAPDWRFAQQCLGGDHWVTVARGPTHDVRDADGRFLATLKRPTKEISNADWHHQLFRAEPAFDKFPISFLVPEEEAFDYFELLGGVPMVRVLSGSSTITQYSDAFASYCGQDSVDTVDTIDDKDGCAYTGASFRRPSQCGSEFTAFDCQPCGPPHAQGVVVGFP